MQLSFNQNISLDQLTNEYANDKRVRAGRILQPEHAADIYTSLSEQTSYDIALVKDNVPCQLTDSQWRSLSGPERQKIHRETMQNASRGVGFIYGRYQLSSEQESITNLRALHQWLNSDTVLSWVRKLSGHQDIIAASAQATRFTPGQFLTRHIDTHESEQRRVAYVLNFTKNWHPDWGGLLQFYQQDGTPRDAWAPGFNALSLFDVTHVHSVTYVTPFALMPRYAVTGWFRATPLA
ncbi:2OG-Fe(II) oxygenase [Alteromonas gilva]|uniref:2OG-Fe(II) oxygenase family protein n=1 Tax=Alteromonas gilva TaxID=2987522 RepID=A0ABT5L5M1_9ALTE|nr:2OG-Fe(II) oxygenase family protein [Alteromonas gilva]MDC8832334.1 2OG-Fe(II) oxygenase family protein [Alteromonas gilva]